MSALVLLVDDIEANRKMLEARLAQEYYAVITAASGAEALARAKAESPDIILLDVMMPGMDGYEVCRRLKGDPDTHHIPVVFVSALDERIDRLRGLEVGAEDFLTKPIDSVQLVARMRSLVRLKTSIDELRHREATARRAGIIEGAPAAVSGLGANILVVDDNAIQADHIARGLSQDHRVVRMGEQSRPGTLDLAVVSLTARAFDGLKVLAHLRSSEATRQLPALVVCDPDLKERALRALDLGANDLIYRPIDVEELQARVRTLVKRRRFVEAMRGAVDQSIEIAVTDPLTGLNNRRYLTNHLESLVQRAARGGDPVALIIADIDHFKRINDTFGHDAGDDVLKEFAARLASNFRPMDIACRFGGEEFVVAMPNTRGDYACLVADRLRRHIAGAPFPIRGGREAIPVTVSLGVAVAERAGDSMDKLLKRADEALYRAKSEGRNRVISAAA